MLGQRNDGFKAALVDLFDIQATVVISFKLLKTKKGDKTRQFFSGYFKLSSLFDELCVSF